MKSQFKLEYQTARFLLRYLPDEFWSSYYAGSLACRVLLTRSL